jgi:hypothetical protein
MAQAQASYVAGFPVPLPLPPGPPVRGLVPYRPLAVAAVVKNALQLNKQSLHTLSVRETKAL